jgi:hypothetical protein
LEEDNGCPDMIISNIDLGVPAGDGRGLWMDTDCDCGGKYADDDRFDPGTTPTSFEASGRDGGGISGGGVVAMMLVEYDR